MRGWKPAYFATTEDEDAVALRPVRRRRRPRFLPYAVRETPTPSDTERALGHAVAAERAALLDRREFLDWLPAARVAGPFALSCAATGFIYARLGETPAHIPLADFLRRDEIEERKRFLLGDIAAPPPPAETAASSRTIAEQAAPCPQSGADRPVPDLPSLTHPASPTSGDAERSPAHLPHVAAASLALHGGANRPPEDVEPVAALAGAPEGPPEAETRAPGSPAPGSPSPPGFIASP